MKHRLLDHSTIDLMVPYGLQTVLKEVHELTYGYLSYADHHDMFGLDLHLSPCHLPIIACDIILLQY